MSLCTYVISTAAAFCAKDAVVANEEVIAKDALVTVPTTFEAVTKDAVCAVVTKEAVVAVPCSDPVNPPVELALPVINRLPDIIADPVYGNEVPVPLPPLRA